MDIITCWEASELCIYIRPGSDQNLFRLRKESFEHVKFKLYNSTDGYYVMAEKSTTEDGVYYVCRKDSQ